jgi:hypothetical protein
MNVYSEKTARAACWLFDRKHRSVDWSYKDLTKENPDPETLGFDRIIAYQIFTILEHEGLIEPFEFTDKEGKQRIDHRLILTNQAKWDSVMHPPGFFGRVIWPPIRFVFTNVVTFILFVCSVIITAIVSALITKWLS